MKFIELNENNIQRKEWMADKKTRLQKAQSEIRNLRQENNNLKIENGALRDELVELSKSGEKRIDSPAIKKSVYIYMYEMVIAALILVFVYWIAINGYEKFDIPYNLFLALVVLISIKCLFDNKEFRVGPIVRTIFSDLIKPALSMLTGLFLCMLCLGEAWKGAKNYALDVAYTMILVLAVTIAVLIIVVISYLLIGIKTLIVKKRR